MKIVKAGFKRITEPSPTKKIEQIARLCYKSEDKIAEGTDIKMIQSLMRRGHTAMLEHASACVEVDYETYALILDVVRCNMQDVYTNPLDDPRANKYPGNSYLRFTRLADFKHAAEVILDNPADIASGFSMGFVRFLISGNMRAWLETFAVLQEYGCLPTVVCNALVDYAGGENGILGAYMDCGEVDEYYDYEANDAFANLITDYTKLTDAERMIHEDISIQFTTDRGVTHELVRHRDGCSFAQESTRYCNYAQDKFDQEITVIAPCFFDVDDPDHANLYAYWAAAMEFAETKYMELLDNGATPQQARTALPHSVKADIVITTNLREWHHILALRACDVTGAAHPQMHEIMQPLLVDLRNDYSFAFGDLKMLHENA